MKRLWFYISGYEDAKGLAIACKSIRGLWGSPDKYPIVYSDGAYEKFPHQSPRSRKEVLDVAHEHATFVVDWPVAAPTEFLKRTSYWAGNPGDYALILDTDEVVISIHADRVPEDLTERAYLVGIRGPGSNRDQGRVSRLFRIEKDVHHWGAHEVVFYGQQQSKRTMGKTTNLLSIIHMKKSHWSDDHRRAKKKYYDVGIREDEARFRRKIGS